MKSINTIVLTGIAFLVIGCETTNSIPYKASTSNVISLQQKMQAQGKN